MEIRPQDDRTVELAANVRWLSAAANAEEDELYGREMTDAEISRTGVGLVVRDLRPV
jgi:hypothetical protein